MLLSNQFLTSTNTPVVFELVSAYGGVGLSLGLPYVSSSLQLHF